MWKGRGGKGEEERQEEDDKGKEMGRREREGGIRRGGERGGS